MKYICFPQTEPPPSFIQDVLDVFRKHESEISTSAKPKGLNSDSVLASLRPDLQAIGFQVETSKRKSDIIERPVIFGENGRPSLRYQIDAYHDGWRCGLEVEAGRAVLGGAIYRDLIQAMVMVQVDHLCLAVPQTYKFRASGKDAVSKDYETTKSVATAIYSHTRVVMPYGLTVIGY